MIIERIVSGPLYANCYFVSDDTENEWVLIDAPYPDDKLIAYATELGDKLKYIILTHCHYDHIAAAQRIKAVTGAKIVIHTDDEKGLLDSSISLSRYLSGEDLSFEPDETLTDKQQIQCGELTFTVMHTPGHTSGSCCFICDAVIFSGDTLFAGSMGRIDFPTGDARQMRASLKALSDLDGDYTVYPGHYEKTTLADERKTNPYM